MFLKGFRRTIFKICLRTSIPRKVFLHGTTLSRFLFFTALWTKVTPLEWLPCTRWRDACGGASSFSGKAARPPLPHVLILQNGQLRFLGVAVQDGKAGGCRLSSHLNKDHSEHLSSNR